MLKFEANVGLGLTEKRLFRDYGLEPLIKFSHFATEFSILSCLVCRFALCARTLKSFWVGRPVITED